MAGVLKLAPGRIPPFYNVSAMSEKVPPYFSRLMEQLEAGEASVRAAFGRHVHWGYWDDPAHQCSEPQDYGQAAEQLSLRLLELAMVENCSRLLDVGCGLGGTIQCLNSRLDGMQLVGVNVDPWQLQYAANKITANSDNIIQFVVADAERLPFPDASFDTVLAVECVFHFDREAFFAEVGRVLRPGGRLTLSDFVPAQRTAELLGAFDLSSHQAVKRAYGNIDISWSLSRYQQLAERYGLRVERSLDIAPHTLPTYGYLKQSVESWEEEAEREQFLSATTLLEKATRRNYMQYQILRFERTDRERE